MIKAEQKNVERMDINTFDQKGKNFILFGKEKHRYIDDGCGFCTHLSYPHPYHQEYKRQENQYCFLRTS
jgi:hypothetical protein